MELEEKLKEMSSLFGNAEELTDTDRYMILATLTTDSASTLTITHEGKFIRDWLADNLSDTLGFDINEIDSFERWAEIVHPEDINIFWKSIKKIKRGKPVSVELRIVTAEKKTIWISNTVYPLKDNEGRIVRLISAVKDITERKLFEKEIHKSQRLESLGMLAGGIAHDFNNIMSAILGNIYIASIHAGSNEAVRDNLNAAEESIKRARLLTKQLLVFARGGIPKKNILDLVQIVKESASLSLTGSNMTIDYQPEDISYTVLGDSAQLMQVFQNITLNAAQSSSWKGKIKIEFSIKTIDDYHPALKPGPHVSVKIMDNGPGIPSDNIETIFDPFFSTRKNGTGLGLTVAHSVIKKHFGMIDVESIPGESTVFEILLPLHSGDIQAHETTKPGFSKGKGRALIMDDQSEILKTLSAMLDILGYKSESASGGGYALQLYTDSLNEGSPYDFVILDLTVPGEMGGIECARRIRELHNEAKIIFSSGYSAEDIISDEPGMKEVIILEKPYDLEQLNSIIASIDT